MNPIRAGLVEKPEDWLNQREGRHILIRPVVRRMAARTARETEKSFGEEKDFA
jgi:hypothetical protein